MTSAKRRKRPRGGASGITLAEWLAMGEGLVPALALEIFRGMARQHIAAEREALRVHSARLDEQDRVLGGVGERRSSGRRGYASVPALVLEFIAKLPGTTATEIVAYVVAKLPAVNPMNVHTALHRLTKADGPLRREGTKRAYKYFPRTEAKPM